ncbi:hypothetical protein KAI65_02825 [Candidatus Parcubacteria bacterium]|nr:hypothetical protein [Candidatus Parcubacteria bacterium]
MKFFDIIDNIKQPIFSLHDLRMAKINIFPYQMTKWTKDGHLIKIRNGLYAIADKKDQLNMEMISHLLYEPSYISLERALSKYGLIPEMVYNSTAITTRQTKTFQNEFGSFMYRSIKKDLFFGFKKIKEMGGVYLLAEPEKALLDYFYLNSARINDLHDVSELRLNKAVIRGLDKKKLKKYLKVFRSKKLEQICLLLNK